MRGSGALFCFARVADRAVQYTPRKKAINPRRQDSLPASHAVVVFFSLATNEQSPPRSDACFYHLESTLLQFPPHSHQVNHTHMDIPLKLQLVLFRIVLCFLRGVYQLPHPHNIIPELPHLPSNKFWGRQDRFLPRYETLPCISQRSDE